MKKSRFTEEQTVRILKEVETGAKVVETCRKLGISEASRYRRRSKLVRARPPRTCGANRDQCLRSTA